MLYEIFLPQFRDFFIFFADAIHTKNPRNIVRGSSRFVIINPRTNVIFVYYTLFLSADRFLMGV